MVVAVIIAILFMLTGIIGAFMSRFPSPIFVLIAVIILAAATPLPISWWQILVVVLLTAACLILDWLVPRWMKGIKDFSQWSKWGTIIGSTLTLILLPIVLTPDGNISARLPWLIISFFLLPFLFAVSFEWINLKQFAGGLRSGATATLSFYATTLLKLLTVAFSIFIILTL